MAVYTFSKTEMTTRNRVDVVEPFDYKAERQRIENALKDLESVTAAMNYWDSIPVYEEPKGEAIVDECSDTKGVLSRLSDLDDDKEESNSFAVIAVIALIGFVICNVL